MNTKEKILSLQVLRAFAFVGVVLSHTAIPYLGRWGVSVFFVLSGFLMVYNCYDSEMSCTIKSSVLFALKKIKRLYPLYLCTVIAILPLSGFMYRPLLDNVSELAIHVLLLQALFKDGEMIARFNGPAWYLSASMFICFSIPFVIVQIRKYTNKVIPIIVCVLCGIFQIVFTLVMPVDAYRFPLSRLADVVVGCNLGYLYITRNVNVEKDKRSIYTLCEIGVIVFIIISLFLFCKIPQNNFLVFLPSTALLVWFFAIQRGYISKVLTNKFLIYIGSISPSGFLIHRVVIRYIIVLCDHILHLEYEEINKYILFISTFVLTILCSEIWLYFEKKLREQLAHIL